MRSLPGGESWIMAPVLAGKIRYESLIDGSIDLADVALNVDALMCEADNQARIQRVVENRRRTEAEKRAHQKGRG